MVNVLEGPIVAVVQRSVEFYQPRRLLDWQRPEQGRVDQAEDRRVRPDAERHRNNGEGGKAGLFQKLTQTKPDILQECFHRRARFLHNEMQPGGVLDSTVCRAQTLRREAARFLRVGLGKPATRFW